MQRHANDPPELPPELEPLPDPELGPPFDPEPDELPEPELPPDEPPELEPLPDPELPPDPAPEPPLDPELELLLDKVMPGRRVGGFVWRTRSGANDSKEYFRSVDHEYILLRESWVHIRWEEKDERCLLES